jgi:hypothetical protein
MFVGHGDVIDGPHDFLSPRSDRSDEFKSSDIMVSFNSEFVIFYLFLVNSIGNCHENKNIVMRKMIFSSEKPPKN